MCDYTKITYSCAHVRYVVKAWCESFLIKSHPIDIRDLEITFERSADTTITVRHQISGNVGDRPFRHHDQRLTLRLQTCQMPPKRCGYVSIAILPLRFAEG